MEAGWNPMRPYKVGSTFLVGPALPEGYSRKRTVEKHRARVCLREGVSVPRCVNLLIRF